MVGPGPAATVPAVPTWLRRAPVLPADDAPVLLHASLAHDRLQRVELGQPGPLQTEQTARAASGLCTHSGVTTAVTTVVSDNGVRELWASTSCDAETRASQKTDTPEGALHPLWSYKRSLPKGL